MYILGLSCFYHDSAACLIKDGKVVAAAHEERFTRIRHDDDFFVLLNGGHTAEEFIIPAPPAGRLWHKLLDSAAPSPRDLVSEKNAPAVRATTITVESLAAMVFISKVVI